MDNKDLPAFPVECSYDENGNIKGCQTGNTTGWEKGLSKREIFAMAALPGWISCQHEGFTGEPEDIAKRSVACADAILAELNKQPAR